LSWSERTASPLDPWRSEPLAVVPWAVKLLRLASRVPPACVGRVLEGLLWVRSLDDVRVVRPGVRTVLLEERVTLLAM
jgi:hypothetical protein